MTFREKYNVRNWQIQIYYKYDHDDDDDDDDDDDAKSEGNLPYLSKTIHIICSILPTVGTVKTNPISASSALPITLDS